MPEAGYLPIPQKLARAGVKDMVRISDARMSGTAYGTVVLHVAPDAAIGGPLARVRNGDRIRLSASRIAASICWCRRTSWRAVAVAPPRRARRAAMPGSTTTQVLQADEGCDFDFLRKHPTGTSTI